jgi:hypothetical protein
VGNWLDGGVLFWRVSISRYLIVGLCSPAHPKWLFGTPRYNLNKKAMCRLYLG